MAILCLIVLLLFSGETNATDPNVCDVHGFLCGGNGIAIVGGKVIIAFSSGYTAIRDTTTKTDTTIWIPPNTSAEGTTNSYGFWSINWVRSHLLQYKDGKTWRDTVKVDITAYDQDNHIIFNAKNQVVPDSSQWCFRF